MSTTLFLLFMLFTILKISASDAGFKNMECSTLSFIKSSVVYCVFGMDSLSSLPIVLKKLQNVFDISSGSVMSLPLYRNVSVITSLSRIFLLVFRLVDGVFSKCFYYRFYTNETCHDSTFLLPCFKVCYKSFCIFLYFSGVS